MLDRTIAQSLMSLVPQKIPATVTLSVDGASVTISVFNAWFKPINVRSTVYGNVTLQGDETTIKIPDAELNPANNGREIRPRDTIVVSGETYNVLAARLMTVRTVWECLVRKEMA